MSRNTSGSLTDPAFWHIAVPVVGADLKFAVLIWTNLTGAVLHAANLDGAEGLTLRQLDRACGDAKTKLPPNLSVRSCP